MSQPVKLSDSLVLDARLAGETVERSIAGQVEFWARLSRSVELLLEGQQVLTLCRNASTRPLSECLETVDSPEGRRRLDDLLKNGPFPHYERHPDRPGLLVRIDKDAGERPRSTTLTFSLPVCGLSMPMSLRGSFELTPYAAARVAAVIRNELVRQTESFVFETFFSDPAGELAFLKNAAPAGYNTILCFIGMASAEVSERRVAMRVSEGGHDVPSQKLKERFPRILANLKTAFHELPNVWVFDNNNLRTPYRLLGVVQSGRVVRLKRPVPRWLAPLLPKIA